MNCSENTETNRLSFGGTSMSESGKKELRQMLAVKQIKNGKDIVNLSSE